jgi:hypothetical protein
LPFAGDRPLPYRQGTEPARAEIVSQLGEEPQLR